MSPRRLTEPPWTCGVGERGTNPSARLRRAPPLSGEALWEAPPQKAPSAEGAVSRRLTEDTPLKLAFLPFVFSRTLKRTHSPTPHGRGGSVSRRDLNQLAGIRTTLRRNQLRSIVPSQTPAALREKGSGEEGLLSEKPPPPQNLPTVIFSGGSAREGTFLQEKSPPSQSPPLLPP